MGEVIRKIIKVDGTEVPLPRHGSTRDIAKLIGADTMDTVILTWTNGVPAQVMLVDDLGYDKGLPVNAKATALYHKVCQPGTTHQILGDVAIVHDQDFA